MAMSPTSFGVRPSHPHRETLENYTEPHLLEKVRLFVLCWVLFRTMTVLEP